MKKDLAGFIPLLIDEQIYVPKHNGKILENATFPQNSSKITKLLVVHPPLSQEEEDLKQKIIKAIGFNLANTGLLELSPEDKIKFTILQENLKFKQIISFGIGIEQLGLNIQCPLYQPVIVKNTTLLISEKLIELSQKDKKNQLWQSLKQMFNL